MFLLRSSLFVIALAIGVSSCGNKTGEVGMNDSTMNEGNTALTPVGPKPEWAPSIDDQMHVVIEELESMGGKPIETLSAQEARMQPDPAKATMAVMQEKSIPMPPMMVDTMGIMIPVSGGSIPARVYTPKNASGPLSVIVYYQGGGWVIADLNTYDASARALAEQTGAIVVSVQYRKAPEHKFPTQHMDSYAAYEYVLKNAASMNGDPNCIAVAGESAGGNLAINVSIMARDKGAKIPVHQLLVYPVADTDTMTASYTKYATAKPLNRAMMGWFVRNVIPSPATLKDTRIAVVKANLKGLPPTTIILAEIDPLFDDGRKLAAALETAGVPVSLKEYMGVTHEFFGMAAVVPDAKDAQAFAASRLKSALESPSASK